MLHCLLEKEVEPTDSRGEELAKIYYASCINEHTIDEKGLSPFKAKIGELFGGWRLLPRETEGGRNDSGDPFEVGKFDLTEQILKFLTYGFSTEFFTFSIEKDPRNSSTYSLTVI